MSAAVLRWPTEPLADIVDRRGIPRKHLDEWLRQALHRGTPIDDVRADRAACALGLHPNNVWPGWDTAVAQT